MFQINHYHVKSSPRDDFRGDLGWPPEPMRDNIFSSLTIFNVIFSFNIS